MFTFTIITMTVFSFHASITILFAWNKQFINKVWRQVPHHPHHILLHDHDPCSECDPSHTCSSDTGSMNPWQCRRCLYHDCCDHTHHTGNMAPETSQHWNKQNTKMINNYWCITRIVWLASWCAGWQSWYWDDWDHDHVTIYLRRVTPWPQSLSVTHLINNDFSCHFLITHIH